MFLCKLHPSAVNVPGSQSVSSANQWAQSIRELSESSLLLSPNHPLLPPSSVAIFSITWPSHDHHTIELILHPVWLFYYVLFVKTIFWELQLLYFASPQAPPTVKWQLPVKARASHCKGFWEMEIRTSSAFKDCDSGLNVHLEWITPGLDLV